MLSIMATSEDEDNSVPLNEDKGEEGNAKKPPKRGIIYLSTIPPYMNVTKIREIFSEFGTVGRVYLQLTDTETKHGEKKSKRRNVANKFTEGWVEFEKKSVAKKVALLLNNKQVSSRKKSKHYDCLWNIKYLSSFKWTHLHERLAYEKAVKRQRLRTEVELAKKKSNFFSSSLDKKKKNTNIVNKELMNINIEKEVTTEDTVVSSKDRKQLLQSIFA